MSRLESAQAFVAGLAPTGKHLAFILFAGAGIFMGGVGFTLGFGDTKENIESIPAIKTAVEGNSARLDAVEQRIARADTVDAQILCYVRLIANGESTGNELNPRCPPGVSNP